MSGIESPLPPFQAPPELSFNNVLKLKFVIWALWNAFCVCIIPVTATLYLVSSAWNKFFGTPVSSRDVRPEDVESQVNPGFIRADAQSCGTQSRNNSTLAAVADNSSIPLIPDPALPLTKNQQPGEQEGDHRQSNQPDPACWPFMDSTPQDHQEPGAFVTSTHDDAATDVTANPVFSRSSELPLTETFNRSDSLSDFHQQPIPAPLIPKIPESIPVRDSSLTVSATSLSPVTATEKKQPDFNREKATSANSTKPKSIIPFQGPGHEVGSLSSSPQAAGNIPQRDENALPETEQPLHTQLPQAPTAIEQDQPPTREHIIRSVTDAIKAQNIRLVISLIEQNPWLIDERREWILTDVQPNLIEQLTDHYLAICSGKPHSSSEASDIKPAESPTDKSSANHNPKALYALLKRILDTNEGAEVSLWDFTTKRNSLDYLISHNAIDCFKLLMASKNGGKLLLQKNCYGRTLPSHKVAERISQNHEYFKLILEREEGLESLAKKNSNGQIPLHYLMKEEHIESTRLVLDKKPDRLFDIDNSGWTPIYRVMNSSNSEFIQAVLNHPSVISQIRNIERVDEFIPHTPESKRILQEVRNRLSPVQYPLASGVTNHQTQEQKARDVLGKLDQVGVYGRFIGNDAYFETPGNFSTMGDETASIGLVKHLVGLGAKRVQLRISPPYPLLPNGQEDPLGSFQLREQMNDEQRRDFQRRQAVALSKLAFLLPGIDPDVTLPQTVVIDGCAITVMHCDDPAESPPLILGFSRGQVKYSHCGHSDKNYITVRPYHYTPHLEACYIKQKDSKVDRLPLDLPEHSIIPHPLPPQGFSTSGAEKQWIQDQLAGCSRLPPALSENLALICHQTRENNLHSGLVYGLHHMETQNLRGTEILGNWLKALKESGKKSGKPILVFLKKPEIGLPQSIVAECMDFEFNAEDEQAVDKTNQLISRGGLGVCDLPSLPQPVFHHLVHSSNLPTLAEGANLTSFLLQTGHPYLSVLPDGQTPVPKDIGNPLEAFKIQSLSYALDASEKTIKRGVFEILHNYINANNYKAALEYLTHNLGVQQLNCKHLKENQTRGVSVWSLLKKGDQGTLSEQERSTLLDVFGPTNDALGNFIDQSLNPESSLAKHNACIRTHVNKPENNKIIAALAAAPV